MIKYCFALILSLLAISPAMAEETWTEVGLYVFHFDTEGDAQIGNVTVDVDLEFSDILDNLDNAFKGYIEHRRGKWSFIGDLLHLEVSDDGSIARDEIIRVELDAEYKQTVFGGYVGYRILEREYDAADLGLDLLVGARYTGMELDLSAAVTVPAPFPSLSRDRDEDEDWIDAVLGLRLQYGGRKGWSGTFWADVGDGSDSSSLQFMALATYRGDSNWIFSGGYRYYNLEYETGSGTSRLDLDLDFTGPIFGVSYRW